MTRRPRMNDYLKLSEVADLLGMSGENRLQRLRRRLLVVERRASERILIRLGGDRQPRYAVTMSKLREHCPELFSRRDEAVEAMREYVASLDTKFSDIEDENTVIAQELGSLSRRVTVLETCISGQKRASATHL